MNYGFWGRLKTPFFIMAPLANVTDAVFREIIAKYSHHGTNEGGPDVFYTEFVSCDGLCSNGRDALLIDLKYSENEHPIVAQIFGSNPDNIKKCSELIRSLGFDGIDINMGCPDRNVEKQGAGAALIKNPNLARKIIRSAKEGSGGLPVSVKTRVGYSKVTLTDWLPEILSEQPVAITIHARTRKEMSLVPAHWEHVKEGVRIANEYACGVKSKRTLIIGNGDITDLADARRKVAETGADGVMLGRAIFGNPFLFDRNHLNVSVNVKLKVMLEHTNLFEKEYGSSKSFAIMKKHYKAYITGFSGAKELRTLIMHATNAVEVRHTVEVFMKNNKYNDL